MTWNITPSKDVPSIPSKCPDEEARIETWRRRDGKCEWSLSSWQRLLFTNFRERLKKERPGSATGRTEFDEEGPSTQSCCSPGSWSSCFIRPFLFPSSSPAAEKTVEGKREPSLEPLVSSAQEEKSLTFFNSSRSNTCLFLPFMAWSSPSSSVSHLFSCLSHSNTSLSVPHVYLHFSQTHVKREANATTLSATIIIPVCLDTVSDEESNGIHSLGRHFSLFPDTAFFIQRKRRSRRVQSLFSWEPKRMGCIWGSCFCGRRETDERRRQG